MVQPGEHTDIQRRMCSKGDLVKEERDSDLQVCGEKGLGLSNNTRDSQEQQEGYDDRFPNHSNSNKVCMCCLVGS